MSGVTWDASLTSSLNSFREGKFGDGHDGDWIIVSYEGKSTLRVLSQGTGGVTGEFYANFPADEPRFALIRRDVMVEISKTIKVAFIDYTPDNIPPLRKALISTHKADIKKLFNPYSVVFETNKIEEVTNDSVLSKIEETSGIKNNTTNKPTNFTQHGDIQRSLNKDSTPLVPSSVKDNRPVSIEDEKAIRQSVADVRNDGTPTNWTLIHYAVMPTQLKLYGSGSGGVEELISHLNENEVFYGFFRISTQLDKTNAVRFAYFKLVNPGLPPMQKAKLTTQSGFVESLFHPYHTSFDCTHISDISLDIVTDHIQGLQQTKHVVLSPDEAKARAPTGTKALDHGPSAVPTTSSRQVGYANEEEFKSTISQLRSGGIDWVIAEVRDRDMLSVTGQGQGPVEQCVQSMSDDCVNFGLLRVIEPIDNVQAIKFVLVRYQPLGVSNLKKSAISTKKQQYDKIFSPYHVDFTIDRKDEISSEIVMDRITSVSGSTSKVRERTNV